MKYRLNYKKPVTTRLGSKVEIYKIYDAYMHGAYYVEEEDKWYAVEWTINGYFSPPDNGRAVKTSLDLINNDYTDPIAA